MIRDRRTRIVATLGPASSSLERVRALIVAGVDVVRVNFSHGEHAAHADAIRTVRQAEAELGRPVAVLADLQGPKLRLGRFAEGSIDLTAGASFRVDLDAAPGDAARVQIPHPEIFACLRDGEPILLDDGRVRLRVVRHGPDYADTIVEAGVKLSDRKGVNLPTATIPIPALTAKDRRDLAFALTQGVDWVALSFVQTAADMAELRKLVDGRAAVLAKIEKPAALDRLDEILDLCQGVMVARGDLGVELSPEDVPVVQKDLIRAARERGIPVIVATQMLESMIASPSPTRAEATDVANAVYEGVDAVMLSAETAVGAYAAEAVAVMDRIIARVERDPRWPELMRAEHRVEESDALIVAAVRAAEASSAACIAAFTATGQTALRLARERSLTRMVALSPRLATARRLALGWGIETRVVPDIRDLDAMPDLAVEEALRSGLAKPGQTLLVAAGVPMGSPGAVNYLRIVYAQRR
ncbi:pyruvate kinase [Phenylobacterium sp. J367]|uniref:pyruvate kinase n=1 Tax=Phenylobacterium sp. J367 TaxID=2898435 RepID=UPI002151AA17|nr:pyruvate kinase [Phenylobacterium sp. J367]MCR5877217.1 pyruvate kinase [Phenylobacterium sp. J367]